jgi:hypothetical protein
MGEYATRKSDGARIKIGTCEDMFYLRFEDREKVAAVSGSVDVNDEKTAGELRFRLPFADEDDILPGDYEDYNRGLLLHKGNEWFSDPETVEQPGNIQLHHQGSGLLINVPCFHGIKLPEVQKPMQAFWNGKGHSFELSSLRAIEKNGQLILMPVAHCIHCRQPWRYQWADMWDYIDPKMQERLAQYKAKAEAA